MLLRRPNDQAPFLQLVFSHSDTFQLRQSEPTLEKFGGEPTAVSFHVPHDCGSFQIRIKTFQAHQCRANFSLFFFPHSTADEATLSCVNSGRENTGARSNTPLSLSSCSFIPSPAVSAAARGARLSKEKSLSSRREKRQTLPCLPLIRVVRGARVRLGAVEGRTKSWVDLKAVFNSQSHPTPHPPGLLLPICDIAD